MARLDTHTCTHVVPVPIPAYLCGSAIPVMNPSCGGPSANQPSCLAECPVWQVHPRLTQQHQTGPALHNVLVNPVEYILLYIYKKSQQVLKTKFSLYQIVLMLNKLSNKWCCCYCCCCHCCVVVWWAVVVIVAVTLVVNDAGSGGGWCHGWQSSH